MNQPQSPFKSHGGLFRIVQALRYSWRGLVAACRHEAAFRQELLLAAVLTPVALWLSRSLSELVLLVGTLLIVLIAELFNSAIEAVADAVTLEHHELIGRAKDLGSAAVFLSIILALAVWASLLVSHVYFAIAQP